MTELLVGVMDYADFKERTVAVARGGAGFAADGPAVWFADSAAVGRALVAGAMAEVGGEWTRLVVEVWPTEPCR